MAEGEEPGDYISKTEDLHDCFFVVGEKKEKISSIKSFLANYSLYFRAMLLETDMKEKSSKADIIISDSEPDVFKLMLSYVYGCHDIKFEDVDQAMRFYILVDKCLMPRLKKLSIDYLLENCMAPVDVLNCVVLLEIKELEPRVAQLLHEDTEEILSSPDFLNVSPAIVEFIVKYDRLKVTEGYLWRALVQWATHQCGGKLEGSNIRKKIDNSIKHIHFLKMSLKEFAHDVVPTNILTPAEVIEIFVKNATRKDDILKEAPPKTRQEGLQACVASFTGNHGLPNSYVNVKSFEHHYIISNITSSQNLEITSIEFHSSIDTLRLTKNLLQLRLYRSHDNILIASRDVLLVNKNGIYVIPKILVLSGNWVMETSKGYKLIIEHDKDTSPQTAVKLTASVQPNICNVQFSGDISSNYDYNSGYRRSIIQSIKFSFQSKS